MMAVFLLAHARKVGVPAQPLNINFGKPATQNALFGTGRIFANGKVLLENTLTKSPQRCIDRGSYLLPVIFISLIAKCINIVFMNISLTTGKTSYTTEVRMSKGHKFKHHVGLSFFHLN